MKDIDIKGFDALLKKMGVTEITQLEESSLSAEQTKDLESSEGLEYKVEDIEGDENGLMYIDGKPVVIFIKNCYSAADQLRNNPKGKGVTRYHVIYDCQTIQDQIRKNRYSSRYHFTASTTGEFDMWGTSSGGWNKIKRTFGGGFEKVEKAKIGICQNCLKALDYKSCNSTSKSSYISELREQFSIKDFFKNFSQGIRRSQRPKYSDHINKAPIYTAEYRRKSRLLKISVGYKCEGCGVNMSEESDRTRLLHCDHEDGDITNNNDGNLRILCIPCHRSLGENKTVGNQIDYNKCQQIRSSQGIKT